MTGRSQRHKVFRDGVASNGETQSEGQIKEGIRTPTLTSLAPNTIAAGVANAVVTLTGTLFDPISKIVYGNIELTTTYTNSTTISATFPHSTAVAGAKAIKVRNGERYSNAVNFTYT